MSFVSISGKTAILYFSDSVENKHNEIIEEIKKILNNGFTVFIFDFLEVKAGFSSYLIGFIIALAKIVGETQAVVRLQNLSPYDIEVLNTAGLSTLNSSIIINKE